LKRRLTPEYAGSNKELSVRATIILAAAMAVSVATPLAAAPRNSPPSPGASPDDPWEKLNRAGFALEGKLDHWIIGPLAHLYKFLTPGPIGRGIHNLVTNLTEPVVTVNGVLQLRPKRAAASGARFVINSTIGVLGLIDVAAKEGMPHRPNSFGDTLGRYGVPGGPYIFYPVGGPSTIRDTVGEVVDIVMDPLHLLNYRYRTEISVSVAVSRGLDQRVQNEQDFKTLLSDAADPYATLRSTYLQSRESEIRGEDVTPADLPDLDQPTTPSSPAPSAQGPSSSGAASLASSQARPIELLLGAEDKAPPFQPLPDQQSR
jgi:phospholipid-binding lipoprotein MlaA